MSISEIKSNYNLLKKNMRKILKNLETQQQQRQRIDKPFLDIINNNLKNVNETLINFNNNNNLSEKDVLMQRKINKMQQDFMPYMVGYWMCVNADNAEEEDAEAEEAEDTEDEISSIKLN
jgi:hypothetical protein